MAWGSMFDKILEGIIAILVIFFTIAAIASTIMAAAANISASGLPLASLFASNGVVILLFMVGIFVGLVYLFMRFHKHGK